MVPSHTSVAASEIPLTKPDQSLTIAPGKFLEKDLTAGLAELCSRCRGDGSPFQQLQTRAWQWSSHVYTMSVLWSCCV